MPPDVDLQAAQVVEDLPAEQTLEVPHRLHGFLLEPSRLFGGHHLDVVGVVRVLSVGRGGVGDVRHGVERGVVYQLVHDVGLRALLLLLDLAVGRHGVVVQLPRVKLQFVNGSLEHVVLLEHPHHFPVIVESHLRADWVILVNLLFDKDEVGFSVHHVECLGSHAAHGCRLH